MMVTVIVSGAPRCSRAEIFPSTATTWTELLPTPATVSASTIRPRLITSWKFETSVYLGRVESVSAVVRVAAAVPFAGLTLRLMLYGVGLVQLTDMVAGGIDIAPA